MPKVTIITAVYNKEKLIDKCVISVLSQRFKDFEYILVDDESPDNCPRICDEYAKTDSRIKVIHRKNGGHAIAVNTGILNSSGKYITILDADDYFCDNDAIGDMVKVADENKSDIVITDFLRIWSDKNQPQMIKTTGIEMLEYFIKKNIYHPTTRSRLFNRTIFENNNLFKNLICDDEEWTPKAFYRAKQVCIIPKSIYFRSTPDNSVTRSKTEENFFKKGHDRATTSGILIDYFEKENISQIQKKILYERFISLYISSLYVYSNNLNDDKLKLELIKKLDDNNYVVEYTKYYKNYKHNILYKINKLFGLKGMLLLFNIFTKYGKKVFGIG